ncbi:hypothetical protein WJ30_14515 [Burkholderia diffusa]|nr:hypothetical protein WJ30_14515 [Burkholderia diffusa]
MRMPADRPAEPAPIIDDCGRINRGNHAIYRDDWPRFDDPTNRAARIDPSITRVFVYAQNVADR